MKIGKQMFFTLIVCILVANKDHSDSDCVCVILSADYHNHGLRYVMERFNRINCPSLALKPKIFIVQVSVVLLRFMRTNCCYISIRITTTIPQSTIIGIFS